MLITSNMILNRLQHPNETANPSELFPLWRDASVQWNMTLPRGFSAGLSMTDRVRGTLGTALAEAGESDDILHLIWQCLYGELMANLNPRPRPPWVLFAQNLPPCPGSGEERIGFTLRLFGFPRRFAAPLAQALPNLLDRPIADAELSRRRKPVTMGPVSVTYWDGLEDGADWDRQLINWAAFIFSGPVAVSNGKAAQALTPSPLVTSMVRTLTDLAIWQDITLCRKAIRAELEAMDWTCFTGEAQDILRNSGRQKLSGMRFKGERLTLIGEGRQVECGGLLKLLERTGIGGRTRSGFGACHVFMV